MSVITKKNIGIVVASTLVSASSLFALPSYYQMGTAIDSTYDRRSVEVGDAMSVIPSRNWDVPSVSEVEPFNREWNSADEAKRLPVVKTKAESRKTKLAFNLEENLNTNSLTMSAKTGLC